ncbi:P-loop NTPase [Lonsdalea quercina]|uniref:P-loop NTPase n=1 Tax=Lonsdalea quercina TaxID=71657 RepID=UPI0039760D72
MNNDIKKAIDEGRLMLLLGAGSSFGSLTSNGEPLPLGEQLAKILAHEAGLKYGGEPLPRVYGACKRKLGERIDEIFDKQFRNCRPSKEYNRLAHYTFARIYTLNIDDALERALERFSNQCIYIRSRFDKVVPRDQIFKKLDYIKLNGDVRNSRDGYIFSPQEYGASSANAPLWYEELGSDFFNYTFLFIGTKLEEPLFYHHIERYKGRTNSIEQRSFVITPSASEIDIENLLESNIEHISGTLSDFIEWLDENFQKPPTPTSTLLKSRPELNVKDVDDPSKYISIFKEVIPVSRSQLSLLKEADSGFPLRNFYRGYKPTWKDILDNVPAFLSHTNKAFQMIRDTLSNSDETNMFCIFGSAGSGKSTMMKQIALKLSEINFPVYYLDNINADVSSLVKELNKKTSGNYFIFIEKIADIAPSIGEIIKENKSSKCKFVVSESLNIWSYRAKEHFDEIKTKHLDISLINRSDAEKILNKVKIYGNWTRLEKFSPTQRITELTTKSRQQLLIGLMESTSGDGFNKIIERDYNKIPTESHKALLVLCGLATLQRMNAHESTLTRALQHLNLNGDVFKLCSEMTGILFYKNGTITTRHYSYINKILNSYIDANHLKLILSAYIYSFSAYEYPIMVNISKSEGYIYKSLVNFKTLKKLLNNNEDMILGIYKSFEKTLENEGLYLLQYGLALRGYNHQDQALEKISTAKIAYNDSPQIDHALAQQLIILATRTDSKSIAMSYFRDAQEILIRLENADIHINDGYPIVTLSEGHITIIQKFEGEDAAREIAKEYFHQLERKIAKLTHKANHRIVETKNNLFKYYVTGKFGFKKFEN